MKKTGRIGERRLNNQGEIMKIVEYRNGKDIDIQFQDGTIVSNQQYGNFVNETVVNPNSPHIYGVGFIGQGKHKSVKNGKSRIVYGVWHNMMRRCYDSKFRNKYLNYKTCTMDKAWHNFQNFAEWYENNIWSDECLVLDKDILFKGNKLYSPNTCILVNSRLNCLFVKSDKIRGALPIGVCKNKKNFMAQIKYNNGKSMCLGTFQTPELAFQVYKQAKESYIKKVADEYKLKYPNFPEKLYNAMYNYKVEIDD